ncbi:hypothetical protein GUJ93_ZPchr0002g24363 [Zizania palustris]|uniref:Ubiquitin-like protease family profile domain-containing protein n=1 Tax=Zizania palustris TaxID=103762 RepID=A0A8J5RZY7_ZIZPA|nr:hypothetical protein GUJ93_ZPchr0002g24363 [Zizania palustris]
MEKLFSIRSKVHGNMKSFAGLQKNDVPRWVIESFASYGSNDVWTLQCFMMAVFNALMFPTSVLNINGSDSLYCKEIMRLGEFDWCQAVMDDIRDKVDRWRKNRDKATPLVQGCIAFIMLRERNGSCYANIAGVVKIPPAAKAKRDHPVKEKGVKPHDKHRSPPPMLMLILRDLRLKDSLRAKRWSIDIFHMNHNEMFAANAVLRPLGASSLNVKRKSQIPREVSPEHTDGGDDCPEIVVECSPQLSAGQSSFEQQEAAHAPADTHVQHGVEQIVTVESVQEEVIRATLHTVVQHEATKLGVDARAQQEILTPAIATPVQHEPTQPAATTVEHDEVELPAADTTDEVIRESDTCVQRSGVFDGDFNYEDWNEVGNILRELNEDPTQVSLRKEYDIKEAVALTGEKVLLSSCSWGLPYIDVPKQVLVNDCGFFVMLFLEHYDGEHRKFDVPIIPERDTQYMAELMYYLFFHKMNEARGPSLELFELLAPGKTDHNVIEGTQQIIDSSDATKDGVASCDVEKDDVASRD